MNVISAHSDKLSSELSDKLISGMEIANYELMVVAASSENSDGFVKKLEGFLNDAKVSKLKTEKMGKKPLAYQIGKQNEGDYVLFTFEASSDAPMAILTKLKLEQDAVLRYLLTRVKEKKVSLRDSVQAKVPEVEEVKPEEPKLAEKKTVKVESKPKIVDEVTKPAKNTKAKKK